MQEQCKCILFNSRFFGGKYFGYILSTLANMRINMSLGFWNEMGCLWGEKNLKLYVNEKKGDNMMNTFGTAFTLVF